MRLFLTPRMAFIGRASGFCVSDPDDLPGEKQCRRRQREDDQQHDTDSDRRYHILYAGEKKAIQ